MSRVGTCVCMATLIGCSPLEELPVADAVGTVGERDYEGCSDTDAEFELHSTSWVDGSGRVPIGPGYNLYLLDQENENTGRMLNLSVMLTALSPLWRGTLRVLGGETEIIASNEMWFSFHDESVEFGDCRMEWNYMLQIDEGSDLAILESGPTVEITYWLKDSDPASATTVSGTADGLTIEAYSTLR